jgi:hypothetical protein
MALENKVALVTGGGRGVCNRISIASLCTEEKRGNRDIGALNFPQTAPALAQSPMQGAERDGEAICSLSAASRRGPQP